jgi:hypothetical protein
VTSTCLRDVTALDVPLHDVPLPFREAICTLFPAYIASCSETLILPNCGVQFWRGALQIVRSRHKTFGPVDTSRQESREAISPLVTSKAVDRMS